MAFDNNMLLIDCVGFTTLNLVESAGGSIRFRGKFQEANTVNKNKRMYPFEVLQSNVDKLEETIASRGLTGQLDHPDTSIVQLSNSSHLITKLWFEGNVLMGEGEILNTPLGKILKSLIESGVRVGISSRGVGNGQVNNEGVLVIGESYKLVTFDCVADPSCHSAFQTKVVGKKEHFTPVPIQTESYKPKINAKALVSFFGCFLEQQKEVLKEKRIRS